MIWQIVDGCIELFIFFFSHAQIYRYIYIQFVGTKKSETKKGATRDGWNMIREWKTWGTKRQNIVFPFFSGTTMARQGGDGVFRKNTSAPAHGCRCCIFFPRVPLFFSSPFSRYGRREQRTGCEISKRKHWSEVKSSQLLNFLFLFSFFSFFFDRNRQKSNPIVKKGRIILSKNLFSNSIIRNDWRRNRMCVELSIDRLIKNDILQERTKHRDKVGSFRTLTVSFRDRRNNSLD